MANLRNIQLLRNAQLYQSLEAAKTALTALTGLTDGSPVVGRYKVGNEERSVYGIVNHDGSISFFNNDKEFENVLQNLDYSGITTSDAAVVTNVTETNGVVSATAANVGGLKLTDYSKGSDSGSVASTDTINAAFSKLEKQIDAANDVIGALDASSVSGASKVVIDVTQSDGKITASAANLTGVKLDGYQEASATGDVASTDTLGEALGKLQKNIHEMDKAADAVAGQVVTTVSETDGVVSETKANVKDLQLGGYSKSSSTGAIASDDTINEALSKLENKANANAVTAKDKSIVVETTGSTTEVGVNIRSGEKVLKLDTDATSGGVYTDLDLVKITTSLPAEIKERYQLLASDDTQIGTNIDIPKDSHIVSINYITSGDHAQNLEYVYIDASGNTQTTYVDMSELVLEAEFASGVTITEHVAHGVVDPASETFLTVGAGGFKLSGVQDAIDTAISGLDASVGSQTVATGKHVAVEVVEVDGKLAGLTVTEQRIADADDLATLSAKTVTELGSSNSSVAVSSTAATDGTVKYDIITDASKLKMSGYTAVTSGVVSDSQSVTEAIAALEGAFIDNEEVTAAALTDLDDRVDGLSGKALTEITSPNNSIAFTTAATADGTVGVSATTDASKISGLTAVSDVAGEISGVTASDSVQTGIKNLYASLAAEIAARKAAISSTTINGSDAIGVTRSATGDTITLTLDATTSGTGGEKTGTDNALSITNNGLFLSTNWDCGTFDTNP